MASPSENCVASKCANCGLEFGNTADIEKSLTVAQDGQQAEEWIPLQNGCICCSVKDSGVAALESLVERQKNFDYILLETTGVADPGNIAPMFWMDEGLGSSIYLDGIVTVVDAKNILKSLDDPTQEELPESEHEHHEHNPASPLMKNRRKPRKMKTMKRWKRSSLALLMTLQQALVRQTTSRPKRSKLRARKQTL